MNRFEDRRYLVVDDRFFGESDVNGRVAPRHPWGIAANMASRNRERDGFDVLDLAVEEAVLIDGDPIWDGDIAPPRHTHRQTDEWETDPVGWTIGMGIPLDVYEARSYARGRRIREEQAQAR